MALTLVVALARSARMTAAADGTTHLNASMFDLGRRPSVRRLGQMIGASAANLMTRPRERRGGLVPRRCSEDEPEVRVQSPRAEDLEADSTPQRGLRPTGGGGFGNPSPQDERRRFCQSVGGWESPTTVARSSFRDPEGFESCPVRSTPLAVL